MSMKNTTSPVERDDVDRLLERDIAPKARSGGATETAQQTSINDESRGVVSVKNTTSPVERDDGDRLLKRDIAPKARSGGATEAATQSSATDESTASQA